MSRMTTRQTKEIEKESKNILFDATEYIRKFKTAMIHDS